MKELVTTSSFLYISSVEREFIKTGLEEGTGRGQLTPNSPLKIDQHLGKFNAIPVRSLGLATNFTWTNPKPRVRRFGNRINDPDMIPVEVHAENGSPCDGTFFGGYDY